MVTLCFAHPGRIFLKIVICVGSTAVQCDIVGKGRPCCLTWPCPKEEGQLLFLSCFVCLGYLFFSLFLVGFNSWSLACQCRWVDVSLQVVGPGWRVPPFSFVHVLLFSFDLVFYACV